MLVVTNPQMSKVGELGGAKEPAISLKIRNFINGAPVLLYVFQPPLKKKKISAGLVTKFKVEKQENGANAAVGRGS